MTGILIVAHGSREKDTNFTLQKIREMVQQQISGVHIAEAYMEFRPPNIEKGLEEMLSQGINEIKVVPYFLFEGVHIKEDIPQEIRDFCKKNPQAKVTLGRTLGADTRLAEIVSDRILEML